MAGNTTSDARLKADITDTHFGLADLMKIKVRDYSLVANGQKFTGFIAQELNGIYPAAVTVGGDDVKTHPWAVDYGKLAPLIVKAVQELKAANDNLKAENDALRAELDAANDNMKVTDDKLRDELNTTNSSQDSEFEELRREIQQLKALSR